MKRIKIRDTILNDSGYQILEKEIFEEDEKYRNNWSTQNIQDLNLNITEIAAFKQPI